MLATGEELATDPALLRLLGAAGEAVDPARLFAVLDRNAVGVPGRTIYIADDRGQVVAWEGPAPPFRTVSVPLGNGNGVWRGRRVARTCG